MARLSTELSESGQKSFLDDISIRCIALNAPDRHTGFSFTKSKTKFCLCSELAHIQSFLVEKPTDTLIPLNVNPQKPHIAI